jgi:hypothetical protein
MNSHRDSSDKGGDSNVSKEVRKLLKNRDNDYAVLAELRGKYKDPELVNAVFDHYKERLDYIRKKSYKFKQVLFDRYASQNLPFPKLLKKALKYKKKYELNDDEFQVFLNEALNSRANSTNMYNLPNTRMSRTLGYSSTAMVSDKLNVGEKELGVLQEIITVHDSTKPLHSQIVMQSMTYTDCAVEAITGKYDSNRNNSYSFVHPVIAALFLPKIKYLDEHMLIANIGHIIKCKKNGLPIMTKPDYELYWDMITDPNDSVCDMESPIVDLKNRVILQTRLWDSVLNLRQGRYYNEKLTEFLVSIEGCRGSVYDAPDMTYVRDEGTILRRLLSVFSLRPTIVSTTSLYGYITNNPYINAPGVTQITSIPMVTLRLPLNIRRGAGVVVSLSNAIEQPQLFVENKMIVPKNQSILHSRDVLFFYVNRRYQTVNVGRITAPYNFTDLPVTVAGFEALNDRPVNVDPVLNINDDLYELRSAVVVDRIQNDTYKNMITGCSAIIRIPTNVSKQRVEEGFLLYDPQGASEKFKSPTDGTYQSNAPVTSIPGTDTFVGSGIESFQMRARSRGTIFMYEKVTNRNALMSL